MALLKKKYMILLVMPDDVYQCVVRGSTDPQKWLKKHGNVGRQYLVIPRWQIDCYKVLEENEVADSDEEET